MKKVLTIILVVIVAVSMAAGYLFSGSSIQPENDGFVGPTGEPSVVGPSQAQIDLLNKTR